MESSFINNEWYDDLGERWYEAYDDPVALLRAENETKMYWIQRRLNNVPWGAKVLDVGCGAGFAANALAESGYRVTGLDRSASSLKVAKKYAPNSNVNYVQGDALEFPFSYESFDVVICLDFLEHVLQPEKVIKEISRVIKPGGLFFYHTFSRNWLSYLLVIEGVRWFVKNTPKHLHRYKLFIDHSEITAWLDKYGFDFKEVTGLRPKFDSSFFKLLVARKVPREFTFVTTDSTLISYLGYAQMRSLGD